MNTTEIIALWSMLGTWFAGVATFFAVWMALHLANRKPKAIAKCTVTESLFFIQHHDGTVTQKGVQIRVVNHSLHAITVSSVEWIFGGDNVIASYFTDEKSSKLPCRLEHGEVARFWIPLFNDERNWLRRLATEIRRQGKNPNKVNCVVELTTGDRFKTKPGKSIIRMLNES